jgi:putative salt-induced outer membrane protein
LAAQIVFFVRPFFNPMKKFIAILSVAAGVLSAFSLNASAQTNVIIVTNVVTVMVTNIVSVTNVTAKDYAITKTDAATVTNEIPRYPWESSAGIGFTLTRGNSDTILTTANIQTHRKTPENEMSLGADGAYGENNSVQNVNSVHGFSQYNHLFSERAFGYLRADALHDEIADLQYRITLSPGAGYYFLKQTNTTLAGEFGPAMVFERLGDADNNYVTLRVAERFEHKFAAQNARVWQSVEFLPQVNDFNNYIANFEVGIEAAISKKVSLQAILQDSFVSQPAPGRDQNDLKIISGLKYKF